uniref:Myb/SANT-like domain-containing protein n=1 Tax=Ananas comosus var. bracteatus TaxID=296719 RepID=A0A6V7PZQ6_ANACO|nr:unnamed protein product [Ananas comosus var. bracteatus]
MATSSSSEASLCLASRAFRLRPTSQVAMSPVKKSSTLVHKKGVVFESTPTENLQIDGSSRLHNQTWKQTPNWTHSLDASMLSWLIEENVLGNYINRSFTNVAWTRIIIDFNCRNNMNLTKEQIKNRLKVLKKTFYVYNCLANKSGWGWDYVHNISMAGDPSDWDAIIAENPTYAKCRDKLFPTYKDIAFLTAKTTATGRYGFSSGMAATPMIDSSSSSSLVRMKV